MQTVDNIIYASHAEQFHVFHSMHYNSVTIQTTVLEVQQYCKKYICFLYVELLEILLCSICTVDQIAHSSVAACCFAGTVHGTGGTVLCKLQ